MHEVKVAISLDYVMAFRILGSKKDRTSAMYMVTDLTLINSEGDARIATVKVSDAMFDHVKLNQPVWLDESTLPRELKDEQERVQGVVELLIGSAPLVDLMPDAGSV